MLTAAATLGMLLLVEHVRLAALRGSRPRTVTLLVVPAQAPPKDEAALNDLRRHLVAAISERDAARERLELVTSGLHTLADSWDRLQDMPTRLPYAARELRDLLQQLGFAIAPEAVGEPA